MFPRHRRLKTSTSNTAEGGAAASNSAGAGGAQPRCSNLSLNLPLCHNIAPQNPSQRLHCRLGSVLPLWADTPPALQHPQHGSPCPPPVTHSHLHCCLLKRVFLNWRDPEQVSHILQTPDTYLERTRTGHSRLSADSLPGFSSAEFTLLKFPLPSSEAFFPAL